MAESEIDVESIVEETIAFVTVRPEGDGWVGDAPDWFGDRLFGGFVLSQSVHAVTRTAPDGGRLHSLHGYFLRPVFAGKQLSYRVAPLREGRTFVMRQLEAVQDG
ncbi:MAG TPA: acyl-CoA thioesterase domain-containing protein, partial [Acidimicrobiia bacterium]|nr:acyl-CoA thioesterase domain-containing protein [Acidimicrobiia bacterium]